MKNDCTTCESCSDTLAGLNSALVSIVDKRLYNVRYELNRPVDYAKAKLLMLYRDILKDICSGDDCDCFVPAGTTNADIVERIKILSA